MRYRRLSRHQRQRIVADHADDDTDYYAQERVVYDLTVTDTELVDTGLVFADGEPIYRDDRAPLGFLARWSE